MSWFGVLDRYLLRRALVALIGISALLIIIACAMDLLVNIAVYTTAVARNRVGLGLIAALYWERLPQLANIALPIAAVITGLVVCAPMLKRGEFIALGSNGVSLRRAVRSLVLLALVTGAVDALIADRLSPHAIARSTAIQDQLMGQRRQGRVWSVPAHASSWFVGRVGALRDGEAELGNVIVFADGQLITAERLSWNDGVWRLGGALLRFGPDAQGRMLLTRPTDIPLRGALELPYAPIELYRQLLPRFTLASDELLERGEKADLALIASRVLRVLVPALALLAALPAFVRFSHRTSMVTGAIKGLFAAAVPVLLLLGTGAVADSTALHPAVITAIGALLAALPALWWWLTWRL